MTEKRITLFCGHYGSGKTNIAVNFAEALRGRYDRVMLADLDIVNPYFRAKDSKEELLRLGIRLVCSQYANSNVDIPALPQDTYAITGDRSYRAVVDVGGDDRGALALGRLVPDILRENDYDMFFVVNKYRPLTADADSAIEIMHEIQAACGLPFTGIVNNSNLGCETTAEDVISSGEYAREICLRTGLPIAFTSVKESLYEGVKNQISPLFLIKTQKKIV